MMKSGIAVLLLAPVAVHAQAPAAAVRQAGTVKSVDAASITLTTGAGVSVTMSVPATATLLQLAPGSTDLKSATPTTLGSVAPGDRVLITARADQPSTAARVILIKANAIAARNSASQEEWQRHGTSGLVQSIDPPDLTIAHAATTVQVVTTPATIIRRYASDSIRFGDARPGTLADIRTGDQLSVRGARSADGSSITADEIVSGSFENLSGVLKSVDAASSTATFTDLASKRDVTVKLTANTDIRHLPAQASAAFNTRNTGAAPAGEARAGSGGRIVGGEQGAGRSEGQGPGSGHARNAGMDLSRMLPHLPSEAIADLKPGDTVMIVASAGPSAELTGITVLTGVEQILSSTNKGETITLSPWNLAGVPEGGGA